MVSNDQSVIAFAVIGECYLDDARDLIYLRALGSVF